MIRTAIVLLAAAAALSGCKAPPAEPPAPSSAPAAVAAAPAVHAPAGQSFTAAEAARCVSGGGKVEPRGRLRTDYCLIPAPDAGKVCTGDADCTGKCLAEDPGAAPDRPVSGRCQADNAPVFGCHALVEGGRIGPALCVD